MSTSRIAAVKRTALSLALPAVLALGLAPGAEAAGPRPDFQMPFACGQTWDASTYTSSDPTTKTTGQTRTASTSPSAATTSTTSAWASRSWRRPPASSATKFELDNGETHMYVDHGGGWKTYYVHTKMGPLEVGDEVAQGQQIGQVDKLGSPTLHLHYTQLRDGEAVRVAFDGTRDRHPQGQHRLLRPLGPAATRSR